MEQTTKILVDEHKNILKLADALERECNAINKGKNIDENFFKKAVDFIRNYADKFHHAKEEDILFKEFCKDENKQDLHCNPVEQMMYEHNLGRDAVKRMEEAMKDKNKTRLVENAEKYVALIREHIFKEDNILYPMSESVLNKKIQESMLKKFEKIAEQRSNEVKEYILFIKEIQKK